MALALAFLQGGYNQNNLNNVIRERGMSKGQAKRMVETARRIKVYVSPEQQAINKMTHWQRSQWEKAGRNMDRASLEKFASLTKANRFADKTE